MSGTFTERWYRLALRAFPPGHRAEYGAEILGTLLNDTPRRVPSPRETAGLLTAGLAARARAATTPWWTDGVRLGLSTLALANLAYGIADHASLGWLAASALLVLALLRGWVLMALPLALAVAFSTGRAMLVGMEATTWPSQIFGPAYHNWISLAPYGVLAVGAIALAAARPRNLRARPLWWLVIPAAALALTYLPGTWEYGEVWQLFRAGTESVLLLAGLLATAVARTPRWALAAAIYVLPGVTRQLVNPPSTTQDLDYWLILTGLLLAMTATAWQARPVPETRHPR
ncbi:hypothetical protein [Actinomadura terrae]|uniref:hypothetical protein n=1 Tax=Actinomadura terrae TaxID=604353 RepID=UPI001FA7CFC9|nr:hypothetical protein [Actinomadura terrae]